MVSPSPSSSRIMVSPYKDNTSKATKIQQGNLYISQRFMLSLLTGTLDPQLTVALRRDTVVPTAPNPHHRRKPQPPAHARAGGVSSTLP